MLRSWCCAAPLDSLMTTPFLSVIVPVYNRAGLVGETLRALLAQTRPADEIIVVDDGSTDGSTAAARAFGDAVRVVEVPNGGPARARNRGLAEARGDLVQFMDSDDLPTPQFLEARLAALTVARADIAYGPWMPAWIGQGRVWGDGLVRQTAPTEPALEAFLSGWVLFIPNTMIRRSLLEDVGGYPEGLLTGEDMLLLFRLLRRTDRLVHTNRSLLLVRQHPEGQISASATLTARRIADELVLTAAVRAELAQGAANAIPASAAAIRAWDRRRARAFAQAHRSAVAIPAGVGPPPSMITGATAATERIMARVAARIRFSRNGNRLAPHFHAAPAGQEYMAEIHALGLAPFSARQEV